MENTKDPAARVEAVDDLFEHTPIGIIRSMQAYLRALPDLLANPKYRSWWVAYAENEQIGIAASGNALLRKCIERGLQSDQFYVGHIVPQDPEDWSGLDLH